MLHELHHLQHQQSGTSADPYDEDPSKRWKEELSCDAYATRFLLEKIDDYANSEKVPPEQVRLKRELGVYFALFALTLLAKNKWDDSPTHPAVQKRIKAAHKAMGPKASEISYTIAHTAFAALREIWPSAPGIWESRMVL